MSLCELCDKPTKRGGDGLCLRCRSSLLGIRVVASVDVDLTDQTILARGGYPPPLSEVIDGDDD